jgi:predicted flap endonuclease-1-like 5' DNA nuclease
MTQRSYSLAAMRDLTADERAAFASHGIRTTRALLAAAAGGERSLARTVGVPPDRMRVLVNRAELVQVEGIGPAIADLLDDVGVNSARELARRNPRALAEAVRHCASGRRGLSEATIRLLVARARALHPHADTLEAAARIAAAATHRYIDDVLFSTAPEGAAFRAAILASRPASEWPEVQRTMHAEVPAFLTGGEPPVEDAERFLFAGRLLQLYTEVAVPKHGGPPTVFVEID